MAKYTAGQRWSYRTRTEDVGSTLLIGEVQTSRGKPSVFHIRVDGVVSPHADGPVVIGHMPFSEAALDGSVLELIETAVEVPSELKDGVATWRSQQGGVFDIAVAEAIDAVISVAPAAVDDPFDSLVSEMRSTQSEELIGELYRRLFSLDHWFFLCEPDDSRVPVQWEFPDGMNPAPALLAFTSRERAASAAVSLGVYPEGADVSIMPASVRDAVQWISGPDCANEWLCFNLTQENFPLYVDDAVGLLKNM